MKLYTRIGVFALALQLAEPSAHAQPRVTADPDLAKSDAALLKDEDKATAELQRRLRDQVKYRNGLLVILDRAASGVSVAPATILWMVDCSESGLAVTFGTGSGDTDNGIALQLTTASVSADTCQRLAPAIGETVLAITKGN
jgi:hypothetical protein